MIILKNISKSYGGKAVLDNVNIEIPGSGVFGIFGVAVHLVLQSGDVIQKLLCMFCLTRYAVRQRGSALCDIHSACVHLCGGNAYSTDSVAEPGRHIVQGVGDILKITPELHVGGVIKIAL